MVVEINVEVGRKCKLYFIFKAEMLQQSQELRKYE